MQTLCCDQWSFAKLPLDTPLETARKAAFAPVDLPHDWLIEQVKALYEDSDGWYRRLIERQPLPNRTVLRFDGVYMDTTIYVNGQEAFQWKYGYTAFECDLTDFMREGENEVLVCVRHQSPNSRWYSGAGIYRDVWLKTVPPQHFVSDGLYASTKKTDRGWLLFVDAEIEGTTDALVRHELKDGQGKTVCTSEGGSSQSMQVPFVEAWDLDAPYLYTLHSALMVDGRETDSVQTLIGFREIRFDPKGGFFLNGHHLKLNGMCNHHDLGALGSAFNRAAAKRQLEIQRSMGVNAVRTSHNPPAQAFLELCDEMGMLVMDEAFDMWERTKTQYDYGRFFHDWHERDVASWVRRDRNHPCVILWSIGNEIYDTHADEQRGLELTRELKRLTRSHDPRGNAGITFGSNYMPWENTQRCANELKIVGYNYAEKYYAEHHQKWPDWCIYGSETASVVQSRGIYHFPLSEPILSDDDLQCSALGNSATSWGAKSTDACLLDDRDAPFSLGTFLWTGFDYIGEPTPYHTKNSYFGLIDTAGFPKDAYWVARAEWTSPENRPFVHIYPYWDWNKDQPIDVRVCSNAPRVRLLLDGKSLGEQALEHHTGRHVQGDWKLPYHKGVLTAQALDAQGNIIATDRAASFGDSKSLHISCNRNSLVADGRDMAFVTIETRDDQGNPVCNARDRVRVTVSGMARLVGMDNGDSTDKDEYKTDSRRLFSGKLLAMIMADQDAGEIEVTASCEGMADVSLRLMSTPPETLTQGVCATYQIKPSKPVRDIPVRKIALDCDRALSLYAPNGSVTLQAKLYPSNTIYRDVIWRACNAAGIDTNLCRLTPDGLSCRMDTMGDGEFYVRCMTKNGTDTVSVISMLKFTTHGFGKATLDPYGYVSAGLYSVSTGEIALGNERGVSIPQDSEGMFGFERVDFGKVGSDEIALDVFTISFEPGQIDIWDGQPEQGGCKLATATYPKTIEWNTYDTLVWKLPYKLCGLHTLCFTSKSRVHVKGFRFVQAQRAWAQNEAATADQIYGDSFRIEGTRVIEIGNNVTLRFDDMDFDKPATKLILTGSSPIDRNTLHLRFTDQQGNATTQSLEFLQSDGYEQRVFPLEPISGRGTVEFVFLPGSKFDFEAFRFEA